ncbi:Protein translocase subunit SecA [Candidatus Portiera aleyrodidarum]|uniref:Protein translocase subunit SecA n=1 Tax=Candidatus Portiera aleyrodidarum TaxID=91844 RepID=A0A6S6RR50_9GAMM|nr:preprotein translocase subunit SecA [Candidatus Portiera aleyrodidarum]CAA3708083.1 Protein translocase subunit SecA [Candidatus Portiera aleyrodidarum]
MLIRKFYNKNNREIKRISNIVYIINDLENYFASLDNNTLRVKTIEFRKRIIKGDLLDMLLPEAFCTIREASKRIIGMRHFDVQLIGGIVLHKGIISEMKTGEGKTIVGTLPTYLNALTGLGVHVITINEFLAKRDSTNMRPLFEFLGLSIKNIYAEQRLKEKIAAYKADITYGHNNEYGFDYLRNHMVYDIKEKFQRKLNFALIDEIDSILIDETRTPLIISGHTYECTTIYYIIKNIAKKLIRNKNTKYKHEKCDFILDEKHKQVELTEQGHKFIECILKAKKIIKKNDSLYSVKNIDLIKKIKAALLALYLFKINVDYIIINNEVIIVDENTGRIMQGKRWSYGLHQAIEAKEGVNIKNESNTLAYITLQNYFRLYTTVTGMTGTAFTSVNEFNKIYNLDVIVIPTNKPIIRKDMNDLMFYSKKEKIEAIIKDIKNKFYKGRPVLLGTTSIKNSEYISELLKQQKISHNILNAKNHYNEANIIAQAGHFSTITIATNMAGRGTDIKLGGKQKHNTTLSKNLVIISGGLHVIGAERNDSRRIDNQLRGRSGRQGDPGSTRFFICLEDKLMRLFGLKKIKKMSQILGLSYDEAISHKLVKKVIEQAQKKVEIHDYNIRNQILKYEKISNYHRKIIYSKRDTILFNYNISEYIKFIRNEVIFKIVYDYKKTYNINKLLKNIKTILNINLYDWIKIKTNQYMLSSKRGYIFLFKKIKDKYKTNYVYNCKKFGKQRIKEFEKNTLLQVFDIRWKEHLQNMDYIMKSIQLRGYIFKDPFEEYKREAYRLFKALIINLKVDVVSVLSQYKF